jgi:subtilisin family serine protease
MLLTNWLRSENYGRSARRRSWIDRFKSAESRTEQSVERLETRVYLSAVSSTAANTSNDWFATLESSSSESAAPQFLVRLTASTTSQAGNVAGVQRLLEANSIQGTVVRGLGDPGMVQVRDVSPHHNLREQLESSGLVSSVSEDQSVFAQQLPDDTEFAAQQYSFDNTGQFFGTSNSDINAPQAWDKTTGNHSVVVPVIDSGIDYTHPDLARNVWLNQGEIPPSLAAALTDTDSDGLITFIDLNQPANSASVTDDNGNGFIDGGDLLTDSRWENGVDDDGNGLTDDLIGWDFLNNDNDPLDDHRHGTHVAGTIGAVGDNGFGVAGVNWDVSLMPLKFLNTQLVGSTSDAILAINYATMMRSQFDTNVRVMNASWGSLGEFNPVLQTAISTAQTADILFVAAAGNGDVTGRGVDLDNDLGFFPASFDVDNIIAVAATDNNDNLARFSNFGATSVDLAAPGVGIAGLNLGGGLIFRTGTSMATPHVTGTVALLAALRPFATASEIRDAVIGSVRTVAGLSGDIATGGVLNAEAALNIDTFAPRGVVVTANDISTDGGTTQDIIIQYDDDTLVDVSTFDDTDIIVRKQDDGSEFPASFLFGPNSDVASASTLYRMTAPGGTWLLEDNGIYEVILQPGEVSDTGGRSSREAIIGSFEVAIEFAGQIDVTTTADGTTTGTLRAAVIAANASAGLNTIALRPGETYTLDISGAGEDASASGDLDITDGSGLVIRGNGAVVEVTGGVDRVFDVQASGALTLLDVTIKGGDVSGDGGGIRNNGGTLTIERSLLTENSATNGGALASSGTTTLINTTISANTATNGAGIDHSGGTLLVSSVTIADNSATSTGGGFRSSANAQLQNTIVANNTATTSDADTSGTFTSNGHNLIGVLGAATGITNDANGDQAGTSGTPIAPFLGELKDNGGFTFTHRLLPGSLAIDAGDNALAPTSDQRNIERPIDANRTRTPTVDIGAHERDKGDIQGIKFRDDNSNGVQDAGEPSLAGWTIYLDLNNNGELDPNEPSVVTSEDDMATAGIDETGTYEFTELDARQYIVREQAQPGWSQTGPRRTVSSVVSLASLNGSTGFRVDGVLSNGHAGRALMSAGDVNGDGTDDLIIGARNANAAYVVFGSTGSFNSSFNVNSLDGSSGFRINGEGSGYGTGVEVGSAGDINGDGIDDLVVGAPYADKNGDNSGLAYVVFGATSGFPADFNLSNLNGSNGFRLEGAAAIDLTGASVSSAGDINGDGFDDLLIGSRGTSYSESLSGSAFVVFGKDTSVSGNFSSSLNLSLIDGTNGFRLDGVVSNEQAGTSVRLAGDINGDGTPDIVVGSRNAKPNGVNTGAAYVVFGRSNGGFSSTMSLGSLDGTDGFRLDGVTAGGSAGVSVSSAGDVNGDGIDDVLIADPFSNPNGMESGSTFVLFGNAGGGFASSLSLGALSEETGFRIDGQSRYDRAGNSVSLTGDVNGDGIGDVLIGAPQPGGGPGASPDSGDAYVVYGTAGGGFPDAFNLGSVDGVNGFRLGGVSTYDRAGYAVGFAGDINGDGIDDITIGAYRASPNGSTEGSSYVVFGIDQGTAIADNNFWKVTLASGNKATAVDFGNVPIAGSISGRVFRDLNTNSLRDAGEAGLESWQVFLDEDNDSTLDVGETVVTTDSEGRYTFTGLTPLQTYRVVQVVQAGFEQTLPDPSGGPVIEVSLGAGEERTDVDFGNLDTVGGVGLGSGKLEGFYFVDTDEDGDLDSGEERAGITVFLDLNNNGVLDSPGGTPEPSQITSATGFYRFEQLSGGTYTVRAINAEDREQQFPRNNSLAVSDVEVGDFPQSIATGSFNTNTDSIPDLVVANLFTNDLSIMLRDGDSFVAADNVFTGSFQPRSVAVADFNQDGTDDLVVGHESTIVVSILLGQGDGTFGAPITLNMGGGQTTVSTGLFTNDAFPDIAITSAVSNQAFVISNTTGSNFSVLHTVSTGSIPSRAEFANLETGNLFNPNSDPDLVVSSFGANRVETFFNSGTSSLSAAFTADVGLSPSDLAVADFDLDGKLDVATANQFSDNVTVLFNNGFNGQFDPARTASYPAGSGATAIEAVDMNVDGLVDLVVTNGSDSNLAVLFNLGGGVFQSPQNFGVGVVPVRLAWSVTTADFDQDGDPDLAVAKGVSNQAAILENTLTEGAYRVILSGDGDETVSNLNFIVQEILPDFVITESGGTTVTTESGTTDSFDVVLTLQPQSNVVLTVTSGNSGEATVDQSTLTFTPSNWDTPQTVIVSAVDDAAADGNLSVSVTVSVDDAASDDDFDPASDQVVNATTVDNDVITVDLDGGGNLTIVDGSTAGLADNLTLSIVSTDLVITDPDNVLIANVGVQISDNEVHVPLATITNQRIVTTHNQGNDRLNAVGVSSALSLEAAGGPGDDTLTGGSQNDTLSGGAGDDDLDGGGSGDVDVLSITENGHLSITTTQTLGQGTDTFANIEQAVLEGGSLNNRLDASQATIPVTLLGQSGNDTLLGGSADDVLDGGEGIDFAEVFGSNIVLINGSAPGAGGETLIALEGLQLVASVRGSNIDASGYTLGPVTIIGSSGGDTLKGGSGDDLILAGAGRDSVSGGGGADFIAGRQGNDTITGDAGNDTIRGSRGRDDIDGGADADVLSGGSGRDTIRGGDGADFANGNGGRDQIDGDDGADTLFGGGGADNIAGGLGADRLDGVDRDDTFSQVVGQDTLFGGNRPSERRIQNRPALEPDFQLPPASATADDVSILPASGNSVSRPSESDSTMEIDTAFSAPLLAELLEL